VAEYPSQTANLSKPYKNTNRNGDLLFDPKNLRVVIAADKQGLIIHVHAIGDGAVTAALDGLRRRERRMEIPDLPDTLTNQQFVRPEDFPGSRSLAW